MPPATAFVLSEMNDIQVITASPSPSDDLIIYRHPFSSLPNRKEPTYVVVEHRRLEDKVLRLSLAEIEERYDFAQEDLQSIRELRCQKL